MLQFFVGLVVGASVVAVLMIVIAPSRRVRAEPPLPRDVETSVLLGEDPDHASAEPAPSAEPEAPFSPSDLAELRSIGSEKQGRRRRRR